MEREGIAINTNEIFSKPEADLAVKDLTYDDYLSAVYSYEDASKAAREAAERVQKTEDEYETALSRNNYLQNKICGIDKKCSEMIESRIVYLKEVWQKSQARFDVKLAPRKADAEQRAGSDIAGFEKKLTDEYRNAAAREKQLQKELLGLSDEYADLERKSKMTSDLTVAADPPEDEEAYGFLVYSRDKKLLTEYQSKMLDERVNDVCDTWVHSVEELKEYQREFSDSEFYKQLREGQLTPKIRREIAATSAVAAAALLFIASLLMSAPFIGSSARESSAVLFKASLGFNTVLSAAGFLELGAALSNFVKRRRKASDKPTAVLELAGAAPLWAYCAVFCAAGFILGFFMFGSLSPIRIAASAVVCMLCGFLVKRVMLSEIGNRLVSGFDVFHDRARADIFAEYEMRDNGRFNFMIFCYLKYEAVQTYLSMNASRKMIENVQRSISENRDRYKRAAQEHEKAQSIVKSKAGLKGQIEDYRRKRTAQLTKELEELESRRPPEPDYEKEARDSLKEELAKLEEERERSSAKLKGAGEALRSAEESFNAAKAESEQPERQVKRIKDALRSWRQTPLPEATSFRLIDSMCMETSDRISILHHGSKPYVIRYTKSGTQSESENLSMLIFHYVHGLCKINPRRLLQINIFDYISDPTDYLENRSFMRLKSDGFLEAVQTTNQFELRLFRSPERYRTFLDVFQSHGRRIGAVAEKHADNRCAEDDIDIAFANKWTTKRNRLTYQVCIFVVPKEDGKQYLPPQSIMEMIKSGEYFQKGLLPVFFVEDDNVSPKWAGVLDQFDVCGDVFECA